VQNNGKTKLSEKKLKIMYEFYDLKFGQEFDSKFQTVYGPIVNFQ